MHNHERPAPNAATAGRELTCEGWQSSGETVTMRVGIAEFFALVGATGVMPKVES